MADAVTIDARINPILDDKAAMREISRLEKQMSNIKTRADYHRVQNSVISTVERLVKSGHADTYRAAGQLIKDSLQGELTSQGARFIRASAIRAAGRAKQRGLETAAEQRTEQSRQAAQNTAAVRAYEEKSLGITYENLAYLQGKYKENGATRAQWSSLGHAFQRLDSSIDRLTKAYLGQGKTVPKSLKEVSQNTKNMVKTTMETGKVIEEGFSSRTLSKLTGMFSIVGLLKSAFSWLSNQVKESIKRGEDTYARRAIYGLTTDQQAYAGTIARLYGMDPETVSGLMQYMTDFRQRLDWGQVSVDELIAAGRIPGMTEFLYSRAGETSPEQGIKMVLDYIKSAGRDGQSLAYTRQTLDMLGADRSWMKTRMFTPSEETFSRVYAKVREVSSLDELGAVQNQRIEREVKTLSEQIGSKLASQLTDIVKLSPEARRELAEIIPQLNLQPETKVRYLEELHASDLRGRDAMEYASRRLRESLGFSLSEPRYSFLPTAKAQNQNTIQVNNYIASTDPQEAGKEASDQTVSKVKDVLNDYFGIGEREWAMQESRQWAEQSSVGG